MPRESDRSSTDAGSRTAVVLLVIFAVAIAAGLGVSGSRDGANGGDARADRIGELPSGGLGASGRTHGDAGVGLGGDGGIDRPVRDFAPLEAPPVPPDQIDPETYDPGPGEDFLERYQGRSGRLSPHASIHGTRGNPPSHSMMAAPTVYAWTDSPIAIPGEPMIIHALVRGASNEDIVPATITCTVFRLDPSDGSTEAMRRGDGEWQYSYTPTTDAHPVGSDGAPPEIRWFVRVTGTYDDQPYSRSAVGAFRLHTPGGQIDTQRAQAQRQRGDLVVTVPMHIDRAGMYYGYAELWGGPDGAMPVAFGSDRMQVPAPGDTTFTFLFGGAVISSSGVDGPYVVRNMRFMQVDSIPPHEQRPVERVLTTPGWSSGGFQ
jgi:hypothetical protein